MILGKSDINRRLTEGRLTEEKQSKRVVVLNTDEDGNPKV